MTTSSTTPLLRRALVLDASASFLMAAALGLGASFLSALLGLPAGLLRGVGIVLVPWATLLAWAARPPRLSRGFVRVVVVSNVAWVVASGWLLTSGVVSPNALGTAFVVVQALAVAAFADLQWMGLRRAHRDPVAC